LGKQKASAYSRDQQGIKHAQQFPCPYRKSGLPGETKTTAWFCKGKKTRKILVRRTSKREGKSNPVPTSIGNTNGKKTPTYGHPNGKKKKKTVKKKNRLKP